MSWLKAIFTAIGAVFKYFGDRQLIEAGRAQATNETNAKTIEEIARLDAPITDDERERVWTRHGGKT